jgi:hypothetical protein
VTAPPAGKPPAAPKAGIGTIVKKLLVVLAVTATIAWIVGLIRLLGPG